MGVWNCTVLPISLFIIIIFILVHGLKNLGFIIWMQWKPSGKILFSGNATPSNFFLYLSMCHLLFLKVYGYNNWHKWFGFCSVAKFSLALCQGKEECIAMYSKDYAAVHTTSQLYTLLYRLHKDVVILDIWPAYLVFLFSHQTIGFIAVSVILPPSFLYSYLPFCQLLPEITLWWSRAYQI